MSAAHHAIVVLGAAVQGDEPGPLLRARIVAGARAFADGRAPRVIVTGRGEAHVMRRDLLALGVPAEAIVAEPNARSTRENALRVAELVPVGARLLLVTQPFHERRARSLFHRAGLEVEVIHAEERFHLYRSLRERVAYHLHVLLGWI